MYSVYILIDPRNRQIRYVGQTKQKLSRRLYQHIIKCSSPSQKQRWVNYWIAQLIQEGYRPQIRLVCKRDTQTAIDLAEKTVIERLSGTTKLCNLTSGGDGSYSMSEETRRKMSESHKGEKNHFYGRKHSEETKKKISEKLTGRKLTVQQRQNISKSVSGTKNGFYGRTHSKRTKQIISEKNGMEYKLRDPNGNLVFGKSLKRLCVRYDLNYGAMWDLVNEKRGRKMHKGWARP